MCSSDLVCTTGGSHLLDQLDLSSRFYRAHATEAEPMLLGFECHDVLRAGLEDADMFCYLEDDIIIRDPWFFTKLAWFATWSGPGRLLQPNRYELSSKARVHKLYIDGDIDPKFTAKYQTPPDMPELVTRVMNQPLRFRAGPNPHSGCFFLTRAQMRRWAGRDDFGDRDTGFMGPLESAATLGGLAVVMGMHLNEAHAWYHGQPEHWKPYEEHSVGRAGDEMRVRWRGKEMAAALADLRQRLGPEDTLLVLPEGVMLNYLLRRRTPARHVNFMPPELLLWGEDTILSELRQSPPDVVAIVHKDTSEYGAARFGRDYGERIWAWIENTYERKAVFGANPLASSRFGIAIMERK